MNSPGPSATFPSLDQLSGDIPPVSWLWPGWIPRGMITLLCAAPGAGKSYFALDLAHRLIAGLPWPDGAPPSAPGAKVIYVDAEAAPQLLNARAVAWGMDRRHLFPMLAAPDQGLDLNTPACQERLLAMAAALWTRQEISSRLAGSACVGA
jgi:KaiC/GvpD/RAD55 family RecA-like ATPase